MQYNSGRSWHLDHARHNKREDYELPMNKRKGKYADGRKYAGGGSTDKDDEPKVVRTIFEEEEFDYENGGMMKRGGKLMDKAKYIPNRMIQAVEVERKGKTTEIDGADVFDGIYVKKRVKYGMGGGISAMSKLDKKFQALGWRDTTEAYYGLDFTPFMSVVEELIEEVSR